MVPASQTILHSFSRFNIKLKKAKVIYNSCNISKIETISNKVRSNIKNKRFFNIVMVGRLDPIKDQKTLIEAFSRLKIPNLQLKIVGKGPEYSYLYKLTKNIH